MGHLQMDQYLRIRVPEGERERGQKSLFRGIMAQNIQEHGQRNRHPDSGKPTETFK